MMKNFKKISWLVPLFLFMSNTQVKAASLNVNLGNESGPEGLSSTIKILIFFTFLTFLPSIVMTMTSFTRLTIIFSMLRTAMGTQTTPSNQILVGLSMFLTFFIMTPVISEINTEAIQPYMQGMINEEEFVTELKAPIQSFMLNHTRSKDLNLFVNLAEIDEVEDVNKLPFTTVVPAFIISELKTAFEISFLLFLPFVIIDFATSSILMSMGMFMLSPVMISLPIKILLFVMVDGWHLIVETMVRSFVK